MSLKNATASIHRESEIHLSKETNGWIFVRFIQKDQSATS